MMQPGRYHAGEGYRYGFNGKELDQEGMGGGGSTYDYGFRIYNPQIGRFLSVDPLAKNYPELTTYQFASNTPIWAIDWDGLEARIYTSTQGMIGHTFITVGKGEDLVVYSYGQYGAPDYESLGGSSPTGQGVLYRLTGERAKAYLDQYLNKENAKAYEIVDADEEKVREFFDNKFNSGDLPSEGRAKGDNDARVVDEEYNAFSKNCATESCDAIREADSELKFEEKEDMLLSTGPSTPPVVVETTDKVDSPHEMDSYLRKQLKSGEGKVIDVTETAKKELK